MHLIIYYFFINILSFILFGFDKLLAIKHKWRLSEKSLLFSLMLGGFIGGAIGMILWHHKTKKWYFKLWLIISIFTHLILLYNFYFSNFFNFQIKIFSFLIFLIFKL